MTDTIRTATCTERLPEHLNSRLADFRAMLERDDPDEVTDADYAANGTGPLSEYPLGATISYAVRVELSTGGPADYIDYTVSTDGDVTRATYHFADWFDHAERTLDGDDFETAERFLQALYGDLAEIAAYVKRDS